MKGCNHILIVRGTGSKDIGTNTEPAIKDFVIPQITSWMKCGQSKQACGCRLQTEYSHGQPFQCIILLASPFHPWYNISCIKDLPWVHTSTLEGSLIYGQQFNYALLFISYKPKFVTNACLINLCLSDGTTTKKDPPRVESVT